MGEINKMQNDWDAGKGLREPVKTLEVSGIITIFLFILPIFYLKPINATCR